MANKDKIWRTNAQGEVALGDMEESHLVNTVMMLRRRQDEYDRTFAGAMSLGKRIPPLTINGATGDVWAQRMIEELNRRELKKYKKAEKIIYANRLGEKHVD